MFIVLGMYYFGPIVTGIRNNDNLQLNHDEISWMGASFSVGGLCGALSAGKTIFILTSNFYCLNESIHKNGPGEWYNKAVSI